jgi:hypothetical protein
MNVNGARLPVSASFVIASAVGPFVLRRMRLRGPVKAGTAPEGLEALRLCGLSTPD